MAVYNMTSFEYKRNDSLPAVYPRFTHTFAFKHIYFYIVILIIGRVLGCEKRRLSGCLKRREKSL